MTSSFRFACSLVILAVILVPAGPAGTPVEKSQVPPAAEASGGLTVVDAKGRSVEFNEPPQRIVVAGKSSLPIIETVYLFPEASKRVVGMTSGRQNPAEFLSLVDGAFDRKTLSGHDAGPEQIAPLRPDVVILRTFMAETLGHSLEILDIPVVYLDLETPEQYFRDIGTLGVLFGNEPRAVEIRTFYQERLDRIDEVTAELSYDQKPSTLVVQYSDLGGEVAFTVPSASWLQTMEVELAGGIPIWGEAAQGGGWTVVNFEQIAAWSPDTIFVVAYNTDSSQVAKELRADTKWQALDAVREGRIYGFAADIFSWDQPDPRWILGVTWLAGKLHPDEFPDLNIMEEISGFFGQMYGMGEDSIQDGIVPHLRGEVR